MKGALRRLAPWLAVVALAIGGGHPSFAASARRAVILNGGPCAGVAVQLDFAAQAGQGLYCLNGQRYGSFVAVPGASFTRASAGTAVDSAGHVVSFASGVPRITDLGLLVEESRTNLLLWSQAFDNAVWVANFSGTGSAPVVTANAALAPDGTMTADQVVFNAGAGTTSSDQSAIQQVVAAANATAYAGSFWINCGAGLKLGFRHAGASNYTLITCTGAWQRVSSVETTGTTSATMQIGIRQGTNIGTLSASATVYLWQADLQQGATVLSAIPTTSAVVTRASDVAFLAGVAPPISNYALYVKATYPSSWAAGGASFAEGATAVAGSIRGASLSLSSLSGYTRIIQRSGTTRGDTDGRGAFFSGGDIVGMGVSTDGAVALFSVNGATVATQATPGEIDWSGGLSIGSRTGNQLWINTFIQRATIFGAADNQAVMNLRTAQ